MTVAINALPASMQREPVLPSPQATKNASPAKEAAALESAENKSTPSTASEKSAALDEINNSLKLASIGVRFEFDKEANTMVTKVVDVESGEMIRQMPSEEVVRISKALGKLQGLLVSHKV